jgi:ABC-2 type transport system permease protein
MIQYQFWNALIIILSQSYFAFNISEDIRLGRISSFLIYPFPFWSFHTCSFIAFQIIQLFIATLTFITFYYMGFLPMPSANSLVLGLLYSQLVAFFWFTLQYTTGLLGFWLEETWILRVIAQILTRFLSGSIIPITFFPQEFLALLKYTPFPYLAYYQIQFFQGNFSNFSIAVAALIVWSFLLWFFNNFLWNKGLRLYTAAGM